MHEHGCHGHWRAGRYDPILILQRDVRRDALQAVRSAIGEAQAFCDGGGEVGELLQLLPRGSLVGMWRHDRLEFGGQSSEDGRVVEQVESEDRHCVRCGYCPRADDCLAFCDEMLCLLLLRGYLVVGEDVVEDGFLAWEAFALSQIRFHAGYLFRQGGLLVEQGHHAWVHQFCQPEREAPQEWLQPGDVHDDVAIPAEIHDRRVPPRGEFWIVHEALVFVEGVLEDDIASQSCEGIDEVHRGACALQGLQAGY